MRSDFSATRLSAMTFSHRFHAVLWLVLAVLAGGSVGDAQDTASADRELQAAGDRILSDDPAAQAAMRIEKPLMTAEDDRKFRLEERNYSQAMFRGDMEQRDLIERGIAWRVQRMTLPAQRNDLPARRRDLFRDLTTAGNRLPDGQRPEFRRFVLDRVIAEARKLFDNNYHVRVNAVVLVSQLSLVEPDLQGRGEKAYTPIADALLPLLGDPNQPVAMQIWAVKGINRVLRTGDLDDAKRHAIAMRLIAELSGKPQSYYWYQWRMVEALGGAGLLNFGNDRAFAVDALAKIVTDPNRHPRVRAEAAKQLGRQPLDGNVNVGLIAYSIADLTRDLVRRQNANPRDPNWQYCFVSIYLAFKPLDAQEEARNGGLLLKTQNQNDLQRHRPTVEKVYELILPVLREGTKGVQLPPLDPALAAPIEAWLKDNPQSDLRIAPGLPPLIISTDVAARPEPSS